MKMSFSTLACPDWSLPRILAMASASHYDGIELRFVENEDSLWKLPVFRNEALKATKRELSDRGLVVSCLNTSCRFHFPEASERERWLEEGERMGELAAELGAPGIRVFGDKVQPGADRATTQKWIAEGVGKLAEKTTPLGVGVWLETHGDFANSSETQAILREAGSANVGVVWDPANCLIESGERPETGAAHLGASIRHTHVKDLLQDTEEWKLVLIGEGEFPLLEVRSALCRIGYQAFVSFEWEKKWHPDIADATVAVPHFARWFRENFPK